MYGNSVGRKGPHGKRIYRKGVIGTACQYPDADSARKAVVGLLRQVNANPFQRSYLPMTIPEVCDPLIRLVRQGAKRRTTPNVFTPAEIKALMSGLGLRERALVLLAASTGLRQSELFGLKWGDINFAQSTMNVSCSIVYGVVGP